MYSKLSSPLCHYPWHTALDNVLWLLHVTLPFPLALRTLAPPPPSQPLFIRHISGRPTVTSVSPRAVGGMGGGGWGGAVVTQPQRAPQWHMSKGWKWRSDSLNYLSSVPPLSLPPSLHSSLPSLVRELVFHISLRCGAVAACHGDGDGSRRNGFCFWQLKFWFELHTKLNNESKWEREHRVKVSNRQNQFNVVWLSWCTVLDYEETAVSLLLLFYYIL